MDKVTHFEIPADDMDRAAKFYSEVFGWKINKMEEMPYIHVKTVETDENMVPTEPGAINGGIMQKDEVAKSPVVVVNVESIDEAGKKLENAGGKMVSDKVKVGDMGFYARFTDSESNLLALWEDAK